MGLIADLGWGRVGLDTAVFIYFIEGAPFVLVEKSPKASYAVAA